MMPKIKERGAPPQLDKRWAVWMTSGTLSPDETKDMMFAAKIVGAVGLTAEIVHDGYKTTLYAARRKKSIVDHVSDAQ